jgi:hypothetical protein
MKASTIALVPLALAAAGCAQMSPGGSPQATAEAQCQYFAREEGFEYVSLGTVAAAGNGYSVAVNMKDALGRPFTASCLNAGGKTSWAQPVPANAIRRWEGKDTMAPRPSR